MRKTRIGRTMRLAALAAVLVLLVAACGGAKSTSGGGVGGGSGGGSGSGGGKTVRLAVNSWVGSQADVAVACWLIQNKLSSKCDQVTIDEVPTWPAMGQNRLEGVLEVWGHEDLYAQYVTKAKKVVDGGKLGATGHIGWYVPTYVMQQHPELATWQGLKTNWKLFQTAESGGQGQLLDGSPSYVTEDAALAKNLGLNLKVIYAGSEAAQITAIRKAYAAKKPLLFYWYTPQWLNSQLQFSEVKLPSRTEGCDATAGKKPDKTNCAYPTYPLYKAFSAEFASGNSKAYQLLKSFQLTNKQQDDVAALIADKGMKPDAAAAQWAQQNQSVWQPWISS
ncbi:MAG TPA: glycine betaine ABC transporter substrate-binding protein [Actinomycetota bacterium]|nr:glycine betaine ABC transporter substrate-binding protein [Actinomycetota bacterium]